MDDKSLRDQLGNDLSSLRLFSSALGLPMYHFEREEFLTEMIRTCDSMESALEPLSEPFEPAPQWAERVAPYQWRMDDKPYASA
jgi:hypothetical protein